MFKKKKSRISLFIEPSLKDLKKAKNLNADCVEIHTGKLCNLINKKKIIKMNLIKLKMLLKLVMNLALKFMLDMALHLFLLKYCQKLKVLKNLILVIF